MVELRKDGFMAISDHVVAGFFIDFIGVYHLHDGQVRHVIGWVGKSSWCEDDGEEYDYPLLISAMTVAQATKWSACIATGNCYEFGRLSTLIDPVESYLDLWLLKHIPKENRPWN